MGVRRLVWWILALLVASSLLVGCQARPQGDSAEGLTAPSPPEASAPVSPEATAAAPSTSEPPDSPALAPSSTALPDSDAASPPASLITAGAAEEMDWFSLEGVDLEVGEGRWQSLESGTFLPAGTKLNLRFRYAAGVKAASFDAWVQKAVGVEAARVSHSAPGVAEVLVENPPAVFLISGGQILTLFIGQPPQLVLLDPATGEEQVVGEAPVNVAEGGVSPDGRWAFLGAREGVYGDDEGIWLVNLASGAQSRLPVRATIFSGPIVWYGDQLVIPTWSDVQYWDLQTGGVVVRKSAATLWESVSPDGRYLAGFDSGDPRSGRTAPATVVIHDLKTGTELVLPEPAHSLVHSCWIELNMAWDESGQSLLVEDSLADNSKRVLRIDRETGAVTVEERLTAVPRHPLGPWIGPTGWQVLERDWGPIQVRSPQGESRQHGEGLPVGWMPDGRLLLIRWANAEYRLIPMGDC